MQQSEVLARREEGGSAAEELSSALTGAASSPSNLAETVSESLARIWQDLLRIPDVQDSDDFFELGGDSLGAIRMLERIGREFGDDLLEPDIIYSASEFGALKEAVTLALAHRGKPSA